mgnify:CR=1 FL=1
MENIQDYKAWREKFIETNVTLEAKEDMNNPNGIDVSAAVEELIKQEYQHYLDLSENRFTYEEIRDMLADPSLEFEFANATRGIIDGVFQAIYNSVHKPEVMEKYFYENDTFSDGYNIVVEQYEKYSKKDVDK